MASSRRTLHNSSALGFGATGLASISPRLPMAKKAPGDSYKTSNGELNIYPVSHASFIIKTADAVVYVDPVGGTEMYAGFPAADLIIVTHHHGDHFEAHSLEGLIGDSTLLITNPKVSELLTGRLKLRANAMGNGDKKDALNIGVEAVPAYNTTKDRLTYHPKGRDNGYILSIDGARVYVASDTEAVPEMRALKDIDIAFVPMNNPYTMEVNQAADGVLEFAPKTVYPYHHRGSDINEFEKLVNAGGKAISVVKADWYG